jgi:hypothetical protein
MQIETTTADFARLDRPLPDHATEEDLLRALREQTEFYLSDSNLPRDDHLVRLLAKNKKRFLLFKDLVRFNRIAQRFKEADVRADKHFSTLAKALEESTVLELGRLKNMVKRKNPINLAPSNLRRMREEEAKRILYVEGFGEGLMQGDIADVFQRFGGVRSVELPTVGDRGETQTTNRRYCFVEFNTHYEMAQCVRPSSRDAIINHPHFRSHRDTIRFIPKDAWNVNRRRLAKVT